MTDPQMWKTVDRLLILMVAFALLGVGGLGGALTFGKSGVTQVCVLVMAGGQCFAGGSIVALCVYDIYWRRR